MLTLQFLISKTVRIYAATYLEMPTENKNNKLDGANRKKICKMSYSDPDLIYGEKHGIHL
jgi:hypothetical protein